MVNPINSANLVYFMDITWFGHSTFLIEGNDRILVDPFITSNPSTEADPQSIECDIIAVTHTHFDHIEDVVDIAKNNDAVVIATFEVADHFASKGCKTDGMNTGGTITVGNTRITQMPANHTSTFPDGTPGGVATGYIFESGATVYHVGDSCLIRDFKTVGEFWDIDCLMIPVGDRYTMGPRSASIAVGWIKPKLVIPMHFNTWPPIEIDIDGFKAKVEKEHGIDVEIMDPGQTFTL